MNKKFLSALTVTTLAFTALLFTILPSFGRVNKVKFICSKDYDAKSDQVFYATLAKVGNTKTTIVFWKSEAFINSGWSPKKRCQAVTPKFQSAYDKQVLRYLTYGWQNGQPIICAADSFGGPCQESLFTLKRDDDPWEVLSILNNTLRGEANQVLNQSTGEYQHYVRFDIDQFLNQE